MGNGFGTECGIMKSTGVVGMGNGFGTEWSNE